jgi:hypothetical protein
VVGDIAQFFVFFSAFADILQGIDEPFRVVVRVKKTAPLMETSTSCPLFV